MGRINILSSHVADLIAAGEVVERPVSIVKELVENSIDAGAKNITVEIKQNPAAFIRVSDDGCGILSDDIPVCVMRHATSKIKDEDDLFSIRSLGFRGEALAAISAVSDMEIITCAQGENAGTHAKFYAGILQDHDAAGAPVGTTIIVRDVFRNTPARQKFLKSNSAETGVISDMVEKLALSNPGVSFHYIKDGEEALNTPGRNDISETVYYILGRDIYKSLLPVSYEYNGIRVEGYISKPEAGRANRAMQYFFINNRTIKSHTISMALEEAYRDCIMTHKYPVAVLYVSLDPSSYDANVHPTKLEVKFSSEKAIYDAVFFAAKTAISKDDKRPVIDNSFKNTIIVDTPLGAATAEIKANAVSSYVTQQTTLEASLRRELKNSEESFKQSLAENDAAKTNLTAAFHSPQLNNYVVNDRMVQQVIDSTQISNETKAVSEQQTERQIPDIKPRVLGELFETYIVAEFGDEVYIIDKHAAHERIIYEELRSRGKKIMRQILIEPAVLELTRSEVGTIMDNLDLFTLSGFNVEQFGDNTIIIREVPADFSNSDLLSLISEMAEQIRACKNEIRTSIEDKLYYTVACKAAIKANRKSSQMELEKLVSDLFSTTDIKYCPHGRPVAVIMTKYGLEKQFGRIV